MINNKIIGQLQIENEQYKNTIATLEDTIKRLNEQLEWFKRQIFGKRSEKIIPAADTQLTFEGIELSKSTENNQIEPTEKPPRKKFNRSGQDKITLPDDLPVERVVLDIPDEQKVCQETGVELVKIGEEVSKIGAKTRFILYQRNCSS